MYHDFSNLVCAAENNNDAPKNGRPPNEEELHQFFLPFRGFCARKGVCNVFQCILNQILNSYVCIITENLLPQ